MRKLLLWTLIVLAVPSMALAQTSPDIQNLIAELGANANDDLLSDLQSPNLLPASHIHFPTLWWDTTNNGAALIVPTSVRAGETLRKLQGQGVTFTLSPDVVRVLDMVDAWTALQNSGVIDTVLQLIQQHASDYAAAHHTAPSTDMVRMIEGSYPSLATAIEINDQTGAPVSTFSDPGPRPGQLWCYLLYDQFKIYTMTGWVYICAGDGNRCWIPVNCQTRENNVPVEFQAAGPNDV